MNTFRKLVYPYCVWIGIFIVIPMLMIVVYAFSQAGNDVTTLSFTLANFQKFFSPVFGSVFIKSIWIAIVTTVVCILLGYPLAYFIAQKSENVRNTMILLMTFPQWINMLIRTYSWIGILSEAGLINTILSYLGLPKVDLLYTDFAVILGMIYNFLPFMVLPIYTSLSKMDQSLVQASYDLGANKVQTFQKVIFPLSLPGVLSGITMVFLPAVSSFVIPKLLGGGQYMLIGSLIENQFITVGEWNFGSAISLVMTIIILISMYFLKKVDHEVVEEGGKKV
ncbi:MAG: ABC transporter permease [Erysipelotrichaceae bacterium]|nr:ABC transporter permease [Erysipelotrichaceae bacterium]MBR3694486.1 ABC transporter permease [Erysipelotrichales bacterium]